MTAVRQITPDQLDAIRTQRAVVIADARTMPVVPAMIFMLLRSVDILIAGQGDVK
jgi:hypothetical protein